MGNFTGTVGEVAGRIFQVFRQHKNFVVCIIADRFARHIAVDPGIIGHLSGEHSHTRRHAFRGGSEGILKNSTLLCQFHQSRSNSLLMSVKRRHVIVEVIYYNK